MRPAWLSRARRPPVMAELQSGTSHGVAPAASAAPPRPQLAAPAAAAAAGLAPPPPLRPRYLTAQDVDMVRQSLQARMAYAEAPALQQRALQAAAPPVFQAADLAEYHPSDGWRRLPHHLSVDQMWARLREECEADAAAEPLLGGVLHSSVLVHPSFAAALAFHLAKKLAAPLLPATHISWLAQEAYAACPDLLDAAVADMHAVRDRDPACGGFNQVLNFKGWTALQAHRLTHHLWGRARRPLALALQARAAEALHVDIHPAATIGRGVLLDHATSIVIGETAAVGDNVSMLHCVTLGGSGVATGAGRRRHPVVGHGVLLGAGVTALGPITLGAGCKVGAGSVVTTDIEEHAVAVGVPARIVRRGVRDPLVSMDQTSDFGLYDWVI